MPGFRVIKIRTHQAMLQAQTVRERLLAMLALFFAAVALLSSAFCLPLIFAIGKRLFEPWVGMAAVLLLMVVSSIIVYFSMANMNRSVETVRYTLRNYDEQHRVSLRSMPGVVDLSRFLRHTLHHKALDSLSSGRASAPE
jgi:uncharacterized membrane protein YqjE